MSDERYNTTDNNQYIITEPTANKQRCRSHRCASENWRENPQIQTFTDAHTTRKWQHIHGNGDDGLENRNGKKRLRTQSKADIDHIGDGKQEEALQKGNYGRIENDQFVFPEKFGCSLVGLHGLFQSFGTVIFFFHEV